MEFYRDSGGNTWVGEVFLHISELGNKFVGSEREVDGSCIFQG